VSEAVEHFRAAVAAIEHEAWNLSAEDRAVLILDCWNPT